MKHKFTRCPKCRSYNIHSDYHDKPFCYCLSCGHTWKPRHGKMPKIICLCGSTRFKDAFINTYDKLSDEGNIVLTVNHIIPQHDNLSPEYEKKAHDLHFRKIDFADEIFVLNVGGYIGESTNKEIKHAKRLGKTIKYLE